MLCISWLLVSLLMSSEKDKDGKSKIFKRKLAPNLEAIKYLKEQRRKNQGSQKYEPSIIPMQKGLDNDC